MARIKRIAQWFVHESFRLLPCFVFFFIAFSLINITGILIQQKQILLNYHFGVVLVAALVMAKVMLLSEWLPITHIFSKKPLIYSTLWKTFVYCMCTIVVRLLEHFATLLLEHKNLSLREIHDIPFWLAQTWLFLLLFIFVAYQELVCAIGIEKAKKLFLGR